MAKIRNSGLINLVKRKQWQDVIFRSKHANMKDFLETDPFHFHETSLHIALKLKAPIEVIKCLLSSQTARQKESRTGYLPLHYAIRHRSSLKIICLLANAYEEGVTMRVEKDNFTSLHIACYFNAKVSVINHLLAIKPMLAKMKTKQNATALHIACRNRRVKLETIKSLLKTNPEAVKETMIGSWSPLHLAILHEASYEILVELVSAHPEMIFHTTSSSCLTPLGLYWWNGGVHSRRIIHLLLDPKNQLKLFQKEPSEGCINEGLLHKVLKFPQQIPHLLAYVLDNFSDHSKFYDMEGRLPLHVAIEMKSKVEKDAWKKIFVHYPEAIREHDDNCFLYPFMIASLQNDVDMTYDLISLAPEILEDIRIKENRYEKLLHY